MLYHVEGSTAHWQYVRCTSQNNTNICAFTRHSLSATGHACVAMHCFFFFFFLFFLFRVLT